MMEHATGFDFALWLTAGRGIFPGEDGEGNHMGIGERVLIELCVVCAALTFMIIFCLI